MIHVLVEVEKSTRSVMVDKNIKLGKYRHYKGKEYEVIGIAKHSENLEELVVYKALYDEGDIWVRPVKMFLEEVEVNKSKVPRFSFIG